MRYCVTRGLLYPVDAHANTADGAVAFLGAVARDNNLEFQMPPFDDHFSKKDLVNALKERFDAARGDFFKIAARVLQRAVSGYSHVPVLASTARTLTEQIAWEEARDAAVLRALPNVPLEQSLPRRNEAGMLMVLHALRREQSGYGVRGSHVQCLTSWRGCRWNAAQLTSALMVYYRSFQGYNMGNLKVDKATDSHVPDEFSGRGRSVHYARLSQLGEIAKGMRGRRRRQRVVEEEEGREGGREGGRRQWYIGLRSDAPTSVKSVLVL